MTDKWQRAKEIAELLPRSAQWSFSITDIEDDAVFNIYAPRAAWHPLRVLLSLPRCEFRYDETQPGLASFEEYDLDGLVLSFITPEEQHDTGPDGPDESGESAE